MMRIEFCGTADDGNLRMYAERRIWSWLGHLERDLEVVTVCLAKELKGRGSRARCRMVAKPLPWASVAVEETDVDRYVAIDRCAERLADVVGVAMRGPVDERGAA